MKPITFLVIFCLWLSGCQSPVNKSSSLETVNTERLAAKIKEKDYTLMYFWTTWCGPCRKALKETLPQAEEKFDTTKVQLLTIAVSKDEVKIAEIRDKSTLTAKNVKLDFIGPDMYLNHKRVLKNTLEDLFQNQKVWRNGVPVFVLVNKEGKVLNAKLPKDVEKLIAVLAEEGIVGS